MPASTEYQPTGTIDANDDIFIEGGPDLWLGGVLKYAPDINGYYWGIDGIPSNPVFKLGCYENFQLQDNVTVNEIRCDTLGVVGSIVRRNYLEATFDVQQILPLSQLKNLLRWSSSLAVADAEYAGIGEVNQQDYLPVYLSRIYDPDAGDWVSFTGTRCQFQWDKAMQLRYGQPWMVGVKIRFYANKNLPSTQRFVTVVRWDPSAL